VPISIVELSHEPGPALVFLPFATCVADLTAERSSNASSSEGVGIGNLGAGRAVPDAKWVRLGTGLVGFGYTVVTTYGWLFLRPDRGERVRETTVASLALFAFWLAKSRPRIAAILVVCAVWCELILSLAHLGIETPSALIVFPSLIPGVAMMLGGRAAILLAVANAVAIPVTLVVHQSIHGKPWGAIFAAGNTAIVASVLSLAMGIMVRSALRSHSAAIERLQRAHQRYRSLFRNAPDGLVAIDNGHVRDANPLAMKFLGLSSISACPRLEDLLRDAGVQNVPSLLTAGAERAPVLIEIPSHIGSPRSLEFTVREPDADEPASLVVVRDVSERRAIEAQLQHNQRLETVGHLAGGVAHDFNNLLTVVGGNATLLAEHKDPEVQELAKEILFAQERGAGLTRQLLTFARKEVRRPETFDLAATVDGMARLIQRLLGEQIQLKIDYAGQVPILADRGQFEQVVLNLVSNGRDAINETGQVRISVRSLPKAEAAALGSRLVDAQQALLEVTDTGRGMNAETKQRLFEPFFTTKSRGQGTGLGLATVHGIVAQSGGAIFVKSEVGGGSSFRIFIPLHDGEISGATELPAIATDARGSGSILVVEDDPEVRDLARRVLARSGYAVISATNASEALSVLSSRSFDLVLTDVVMPGINGLEFAEILRLEQPGARVLFMSGYFDHSAPWSGALDPKTNLLQKPFTPQDLLARVRSLLAVPKP